MSRAALSVTPFGGALRQWRHARGMSQLDLAGVAATSSRHVSFLETGRSRPSREMVNRLSDALALPLRERNSLYVAAGLAPVYPVAGLDSEEMVVFRSVVDRLLESHEPYPAYAVDGHWNVVRANRAARGLLPADGEQNVVRLTYAGAWKDMIDNWTELAWTGVRRLQAEAARFPQDTELAALVELATDAARTVPRTLSPSSERVLCPVFRIGDRLVRTVSVVAQFGSPRDVTLDELRIELIYPADDAADAFFRGADIPPQPTR